MLKLSLATRIALIVVLALMAVWIGALMQLYRSAQGTDLNPPAGQIAALVTAIEHGAPDDVPLILRAVSSATLTASIVAGAAANPQGTTPIGPERRAAYETALGGRPFAMWRPAPSGLARRFPRLFEGIDAIGLGIGLRTGGTLVVISRNPLLITRFGVPVGFGAGLLGTLVALAALIVMHRETRPLVRLAAAVDRADFTSEALTVPSVRTSSPEIRTLVGAFGRLQRRVSELLRARMAMQGGISHDVRTFATRLRLRVEQIPDAEERARAIGDIDDMIRLLDDALLASRAGAGSGELATELVTFSELVRAEVDDRRGAGAAIDLSCGAGTEAGVLGDRVALRRIVSNLVDNALKYGRAAHLALAADGDTLVLIVDDEGSGIPPEQRALLLEPFTRLEASRNRGTGGAGLGLAVVRTLVEGMDGTVDIADAPTGGARIIVRLPVFRGV